VIVSNRTAARRVVRPHEVEIETEQIVAAAAGHRVDAFTADDHVIAAAAGNRVAARRAEDRVAALPPKIVAPGA